MGSTSKPDERFKKFARDNAVSKRPSIFGRRAREWRVARTAYLAGFRDGQKEKK